VSDRALLPNAPADLQAYRERGGYDTLATARQNIEGLRLVLGELDLTGLGGAHFSFARKLQLALTTPGPRVVVCNGAEDEPGSRKDRTLLERNPHVVLEGALLAASALDADVIYLYISEGLHEALEAVAQALVELTAAPGLLAGVDLKIAKAPPAYVAGEASAVVSALQGDEAKPRLQPPYPTESGVLGRPTLVSNCETLANLPRRVAASLREEGNVAEWTRLATVSGDVAHPTVVEVVPERTTFAHLIDLAGGLADADTHLKAIQPGGPSSAYLDATAADVYITNAAIVAAGSQPGCLAVRVLASTRCMVEELVELTAFFSREQCGQCPPCRMKTQTYAVSLERLQRGAANWSVLDQLAAVDEFVSDLPRRCGLISMPSPPLTSAINLFREDFSSHIDTTSCSLVG
jgi:NADH-quinone oxidoreductase subunit F